jgi:hypothetical protein
LLKPLVLLVSCLTISEDGTSYSYLSLFKADSFISIFNLLF